MALTLVDTVGTVFAATSSAITMPAHAANDLLIVEITTDGASVTATASGSGWFKWYETTAGAGTTSVSVICFAKIATSSSETLTVTLSANESATVHSRSWRGHGIADVTTDITPLRVGTSGTSTGFSYSAVTGLNSAKTYAMLTFAGSARGDTGYRPTSAPSGFTGYLNTAQATGTAGSGALSSYKFVGPGVTTTGTASHSSVSANQWISTTLAIPEASGPVVHTMGGTVGAVSYATGNVNSIQNIAGSVSATSSLSGAFNLLALLAGTVAAVSSASGDPIIFLNNALAGTVTAVSSVSGSPILVARMGGTVPATSSVTGAPKGIFGLSGTVVAVSTATGAPTGVAVVHVMGGQVAAVSYVSGAPNAKFALSGRVDALSYAALTLPVSATAQNIVTEFYRSRAGLEKAVSLIISVTDQKFKFFADNSVIEGDEYSHTLQEQALAFFQQNSGLGSGTPAQHVTAYFNNLNMPSEWKQALSEDAISIVSV